jgi:hypothetical protein
MEVLDLLGIMINCYLVSCFGMCGNISAMVKCPMCGQEVIGEKKGEGKAKIT